MLVKKYIFIVALMMGVFSCQKEVIRPRAVLDGENVECGNHSEKNELRAKKDGTMNADNIGFDTRNGSTNDENDGTITDPNNDDDRNKKKKN